MPAHDWHHANIKGDWANALYARQRALEAGARYTETWGIFDAIDAIFLEISGLPEIPAPETPDVAPVMLGM
jgi:hypothetical protein